MELRYQECPDCGSKDALTDYGTRTHCFSCNAHKKKDLTQRLHQEIPLDRTVSVAPLQVNKDKIKDLSDRGLNKGTAAFYSVWVQEDGSHVYPYFTKDGKTHLANKFRNTAQKGFMTQGDISKTGLFGQQLFPAGSAKQITITEGELDAMSVYQMTGSRYPCISVKNASTALKDVADNFEYLNSFETVVICFDKDEPHIRPDGTQFFPGQDAAEKVAALFPLGKVRLLTLKDAKDANDYLMKGWQDRFTKEWWGAPVYTPGGLYLAKDLWEEVRAPKNYETILYPFEGLNNLTYGMRLSEVILVSADTGVGKTSFCKELEHHLLQNTSRGVGLLHLEESVGDALLGLMSITANRPLHLPDVRSGVKEDELRKYWDTTCDTDKIVVWDHFGSNSIETVLNTIRHMKALGCSYIILDHLSIVVSDQNGDERKQLDEISTKLKKLCMELQICLVAVIHINRKGEVRGSAGPEQISNIHIELVRDKLADDDEIRNTTKVVVRKNRFSGRTGLACCLKYDAETGRLVELPKEAVLEILKKSTKRVNEEW